MPWIFLLVAALALVFIKLGAYSVWIVILSVGLKVALVTIAGLAAVLLWRWAFGTKSHKGV